MQSATEESGPMRGGGGLDLIDFQSNDVFSYLMVQMKFTKKIKNLFVLYIEATSFLVGSAVKKKEILVDFCFFFFKHLTFMYRERKRQCV